MTGERKCEKFFQLYQIPIEQQLNFAELHLEGKADLWHQSFKLDKGVVLWLEFGYELCRQF